MVTTLSSVGGSTDKDGEDGKFDFNLEIFKDDQMTSPIDKNHIVSVGDNLYFKLSQEYPVDGLIFSIDGNIVIYRKDFPGLKLFLDNQFAKLISRLHCQRSRIRERIFNHQRSMSKRFC